MKTVTCMLAGAALIALTGSAYAADHLATAAAAGGLTPGVSQPYRNGLNNPGRGDELVPGQGSPLSGNDHSTPATDQANSGVGTTPKPYTDGKTAPSAHSNH